MGTSHAERCPTALIRRERATSRLHPVKKEQAMTDSHAMTASGPMTPSHKETRKPLREHSVPLFWPFAAAIEFGEEGMRLFQDNLTFLKEAQLINAPPAPEWATPNRIDLELDTMRLRDFSTQRSVTKATPVLIDPPYAGHSSSIA